MINPIICKIGPFTVYAYGLMLAVAFLVSSHLAGIQAKKDNINPGLIFNFSFVIFISGIIGARLFFIIENIGYYLNNPLEIIMLQQGGLSWFGALTLAGICGSIYLKKNKLPVYKILDLIVPFIALGQAIGRIGCLLNGCCFGFTIIPVQLYSSLILILIFIILRFLQDRPHREGEVFFTYLMLYSIKRFFIEFWRADNEIILFRLTLFQILSIFLFCLAALKLYLTKCRNTH